MTDRHAGYIVILQDNIRADDAEPIINAIWQIKGVLDVQPVINGAEIQIAESRARMEIAERLLDLYKEILRR